MFKSRKRWLAGAAIAIVIAAVAGGFAAATGAVGDDDEPLTGSTYERAVEAALAHTGGGAVTETEVGDDGATYSVEVRLDDGRLVEVNLDEDFSVIGQEDDDDGPGDDVSDDD